MPEELAVKSIHMTLREAIVLAVLVGLMAGENPPTAQIAVATANAVAQEVLQVSALEMLDRGEIRDVTP